MTLTDQTSLFSDSLSLENRIAVLSPLGTPHLGLIRSAMNGGYWSIVDLGDPRAQGYEPALSTLRSLKDEGPIGVRVSMAHRRGAWKAHRLADFISEGLIEQILVDESDDWGVWTSLRATAPNHLEIWVEVRTIRGAELAAQDSRINGIILTTEEAAGASGDLSAYLWLQRISQSPPPKPVWIRGGMTLCGMVSALCTGVERIIIDEHLLGCVELQTIHHQLATTLPHLNRSHSHRGLIFPDSGHQNVSLPIEPRARYARFLTWPHSRGWQTLKDKQNRDLSPSDKKESKIWGDLPWGDQLEHHLIPLSSSWPQINRIRKKIEQELEEAPRCVEVIKGIVSELAERLHLAQIQVSPLRPPSPLAQSLGIRYPIFQGPMTRVSDTPAFALSVAQEGGLPFIALSLMREEQARQVLKETKMLLGEYSWGVGVLGFSPPELRAIHFKLIKEIQPTTVLIAGGRPSLSRDLEEAGIPTYLHAPSPELLERFIDDGARRFVFEGSECGGHIGPLSSFALWEAQLEVMERSSKVNELEVLFAGGIHDAHSAGLVTAICSKIKSLGAKIGVLMGTGYLFTKEAVESGAILPAYQDVAINLESTATVHTAPGHSTRCAPTHFINEFESRRQDLIQAGVKDRDLWEELEKLNVGRLRIASKGLIREGTQLVEVDTHTQSRSGMYMIGEVATLRHDITDIRSLHDQVALESEDWLNDRLAQLQTHNQSSSTLLPRTLSRHTEVDEIAIVGISCLFPKAVDHDQFWANIMGGIDAITEIPEARWSIEQYYDPQAPAGRKSSSKWGGFLDPVPFDPMHYGIPPQTLTAVEPVQLLALEVASRALRDAGYQSRPGSTGRTFPREMTSVIFGAEAGTDLAGAYTLRGVAPQWLGELPQILDKTLPELTEDSFAGVLANVIAGRIANRLDLGGVNYTVDAACASSLAALDSSVKSLLSYESDVVICGGADLHNSVNDYLMFSSVHALSKTGRCRPFDAGADGISLGEGVAAVVLKRVKDAHRDGDRIYAVISSVAGSSDGRALGLTAPRADGQKRALERAYQRAGVSPTQIGLVEAHGTGTVVGDRTELQALTTVYQADKVGIAQSTLGSVKSMIGHTKCAAGLAGLIKATMSIFHGVRPPTLHLDQPNPAYHPMESPFCFERYPRPWSRPISDRIAGVSAFGFGGTNFHAVLRGEPSTPNIMRTPQEWPCEALIFRANSLSSAIDTAHRFATALQQRKESGHLFSLRLRDLAFSIFNHEAKHPIQAVLIVTSIEEALEALKAFSGGESHSSQVSIHSTDSLVSSSEQVTSTDQIAFMFPGQGSQKVSMMRELFTLFPNLNDRLAQNVDIADLIFPPPPADIKQKRAQQQALTDTRIAQPALGLCDLSALDLVHHFGIKAKHLGGHSYGELVALCAAGVISEDRLPDISAKRGELILKATGADGNKGDAGSMAAVKGGADAISTILNKHHSLSKICLANLNAPQQTVISGTSDDINEAIKVLKTSGLRAREIPVACAFHSHLVADASLDFQHYLETQHLSSKGLSDYCVWSNQNAAPYTIDALTQKTLAEQLGAHIASPVRFIDQVTAMIKAGVRVFIEVGPGRILSGLIEQILKEHKDKDHITVIPLVPEQGSLRELIIALSRLDSVGLDIEWAKLWWLRDVQLFSLEEIAQPTLAPLQWWVNGMRAWPERGPTPKNFLNPPNLVVKHHTDISLAQREDSNEVTHNTSSTKNTQHHSMEIEMNQPKHTISHGVQQRTTPQVAEAAQAYFESMKQLAAAQERVMLALLGQEVSALDVPLTETRQDYQTQATMMTHESQASAHFPGSIPTPADDVIDFWGTPSSPPPPLKNSNSGESYTNREVTKTHSESHWEQKDEGTSPDLPTATADPISLQDTLIELVSDRTGYPVEMLNLDLDLESDLSVDSIKRIEILGALAERLGLDQEDEAERDQMIEELAMMKTLNEMISWLQNRLSISEEETEKDMRPKARGEQLPRALRAWVAAPLKPHPDTLTDSLSPAQPVHVLNYLTPLDKESNSPLESIFMDLKTYFSVAPSVHDEASSLPSILILIPNTEELNYQLQWGGASGLLKSAKLEWDERRPAITMRLVIISNDLSEMSRKEIISREEDDLSRPHLNDSHTGALEVIKITGGEIRLQEHYMSDVKPYPLSSDPTSAQQAITDHTLTKRGLTLVTGGARGVTAQCLIRLFKQESKHSFILIGRTPHPNTGHHDDLIQATHSKDERHLRSKIAQVNPQISIKELSSRARLAWAQYEIQQTLSALNEHGRYISLDIGHTSATRFAEILKAHAIDLAEIETVIHAAGMIDDRRLADKTLDRFKRVISPKIDGLDMMTKALFHVKRWMFFSSVSSAFGNIGQTDYSAANATLDAVATYINQPSQQVNAKSSAHAPRAVSIQWGPWRGAGMVDESLVKHYQERNIRLISIEQGTQAFVDEWSRLCDPSWDDEQSVVLRTWPFG